MVAGIVPDDNSIFPPVLVFSVKHPHKLNQEDLHDLDVWVGLEEADEDSTEVINTSY